MKEAKEFGNNIGGYVMKVKEAKRHFFATLVAKQEPIELR
jgi:hypothetical protein